MADKQMTPGEVFAEILEDNEPLAMAWVTGGTAAPALSGLVKFYETPYGGTLIEAELFGLPDRMQPGSFMDSISMKTGTAAMTLPTPADIITPGRPNTLTMPGIFFPFLPIRGMRGFLSLTNGLLFPRFWENPWWCTRCPTTSTPSLPAIPAIRSAAESSASPTAGTGRIWIRFLAAQWLPAKNLIIYHKDFEHIDALQEIPVSIGNTPGGNAYHCIMFTKTS